jgi:hypothetical protein
VRASGAAGRLHQVLGLGEDGLGPTHRVLPRGSEDDAGSGPIHQGGAQDPLQLGDTGREGRLGDVRGLGGAAERAMLVQQL